MREPQGPMLYVGSVYSWETPSCSPYCAECKVAHGAYKRLELWSTPPLLVIHLKRLLQARKLGTEVAFPLRGFDPTPFLVTSQCNPKPSPPFDGFRPLFHYFHVFQIIHH